MKLGALRSAAAERVVACRKAVDVETAKQRAAQVADEQLAERAVSNQKELADAEAAERAAARHAGLNPSDTAAAQAHQAASLRAAQLRQHVEVIAQLRNEVVAEIGGARTLQQRAVADLGRAEEQLHYFEEVIPKAERAELALCELRSALKELDGLDRQHTIMVLLNRRLEGLTRGRASPEPIISFMGICATSRRGDYPAPLDSVTGWLLENVPCAQAPA